MLNPKKKDSILQWFNCISIGKGVESLKEFTNGLLFYQIIISLKGNVEELCYDKPENPTNGVAHHEESPVKVKEQPICENDAINGIQCEIVNESSDALSENLTCPTIDAKTDETAKIQNIDHNTASEIIQNSSENANSDEAMYSENIDSLSHCANESDDGSAACEKISELANVACHMEVSSEGNNFEVENNSKDQIDTSTSAPLEENPGIKSFGNITLDAIKDHKINPEVQKRYEAIKTFIDGMLELNSEELVNYMDCIKGNEFELAKIAVLFLCAWLQSYLLTETFTFENTICHLDQEIQEEIKECLELFLIKREVPVKKREFQDVLIRTVRPRSSPRWSTPVSITSHSSKTKSRRNRRNVQIIEDFTIEYSPVKSFLQSPDLRHITPKTKQAVIHDAVSKKNKQISDLFENLEEERYKNKDLEEKIENLNFQIQQLREEKNKLKISHNEEIKLLEEDKEILLKSKEDLEEKNRMLKQQVDQLREDLKFAKINLQAIEEVSDKINIEAEDPKVQSRIISLEFQLQRKELKIDELQSDIPRLKKIQMNYEALKEIIETNLYDCTELQRALSNHQFECESNVKDISIRNELEKDLAKMAEDLAERENYIIQIQEQKKNLLNKYRSELEVIKKSEDDWKAKFRKADRERENSQRNFTKKIKNLENTVTKLRAQNEAYLNALNVHDKCQNTVSINDNSEKNATKKSYDKDEAGRLWEAFTSGNSESTEEEPKLEIDPENKNEDTSNSSTLLCETRAARRRRSLNESSQEKQSKSSISCTESSPPMESNNGRPQCTENEFREIKSSVMNVFRAMVSIDIKSDLLPTVIEEYEKNFDSARDLINALVIIYKIIKNDFNVSLHPNQLESQAINGSEVGEKNCRASNFLCETERHWQEKLMENSSKKTSLKLIPSKTVETMTDIHDFPDICMLSLPDLESPESTTEVASLKLTIEKMTKEFEKNRRMQEERLTKADDVKDKYIQKYIKIKDENENLKKSIQDLEKKIVLDDNKQSIPPKKPCEKCTSLNEKLNLNRNERHRLINVIEVMKCEAKVQEQIILKLKNKIKNLNDVNENLKMSVERLKCWSSGNWAKPLLNDSEKLKKSIELEALKRENEKRFKEDEWQDNPKSLNEILNPHNKDVRGSNVMYLKSRQDGNKNLSAFCFPADEADIPNERSISEFHPELRITEFQWRNSCLLPHLKSSYPVELNTTPTISKYTMTPKGMKCQPSKQSSTSVYYSNKSDKWRRLSYAGHSSPKKHVKRPLHNMTSTSNSSTFKTGAVDSDDVDKHSVKKRKIVKAAHSSHSVQPSQSDQRTPKQNSITQKIFKTPQSYYRMMNRIKRH